MRHGVDRPKETKSLGTPVHSTNRSETSSLTLSGEPIVWVSVLYVKQEIVIISTIKLEINGIEYRGKQILGYLFYPL